jgi:hypothetical protein
MLICFVDENNRPSGITDSVKEALDFYAKCGLKFVGIKEQNLGCLKKGSRIIINFRPFGSKHGDEDILGQFEFDKQPILSGTRSGTIFYRDTLSHEQQVLTIIHEIAHAIDGLILGHKTYGLRLLKFYGKYGTMGKSSKHVLGLSDQSFCEVKNFVKSESLCLRVKVWKLKVKATFTNEKEAIRLEVVADANKGDLDSEYWRAWAKKTAKDQSEKAKIFRERAKYYLDPVEVFAEAFTLYLARKFSSEFGEEKCYFEGIRNNLRVDSDKARTQFGKGSEEGSYTLEFRDVELDALAKLLDPVWHDLTHVSHENAKAAVDVCSAVLLCD